MRRTIDSARRPQRSTLLLALALSACTTGTTHTTVPAEPQARATPTAAPFVAPEIGVRDPALRILRAGRRFDDGGAIVAVALRAFLSTTKHATTVVVEGVDRPGPGAAVVTLLTVGAPPDRQLTRTAVAIAIDDRGPRPVGLQWPLPLDPTHDLGALSAEPLDDHVLAAEVLDALADAGLGNHRLVSLAVATDAWPIVADVQSPAGSVMALWLRRDRGHLVVAGRATHQTTSRTTERE